MSDAIGATYYDGSDTTSISTTFALLGLGTTVDTPLTGLTSDNDGTLRNTSGADITLNGILFARGKISSSPTECLISAATSSDKVTWTAQSSDTWQAFGNFSRNESVLFDFKITIPNNHYVGILAKTTSGTSTFTIIDPCLTVFSDEGTSETPALDSKCSSYYNNSSLTYASTSGFAKIPVVTAEFSGGVGATQDNLGMITNDTGSTITVFGWFYIKASGQFAGVNINYRIQAHKNGVAITDSPEISLSLQSSLRDLISGWYYVELADGDYVDIQVRNTSGGLANFRTWVLEHSMRSLT